MCVLSHYSTQTFWIGIFRYSILSFFDPHLVSFVKNNPKRFFYTEHILEVLPMVLDVRSRGPRNVQTSTKKMLLLKIQCRLKCHIRTICQKLIFDCFAMLFLRLLRIAPHRYDWAEVRETKIVIQKKQASITIPVVLIRDQMQLDRYGHGEIARQG